jgi:hypothetical protein
MRPNNAGIWSRRAGANRSPNCADHGAFTLELEAIDRVYLNVWVPRLQGEAWVAGFFVFTADTGLPPAC